MNVRSISKFIFNLSEMSYFELDTNRLLFRIFFNRRCHCRIWYKYISFFSRIDVLAVISTRRGLKSSPENVVPVHLLKSVDKVNH